MLRSTAAKNGLADSEVPDCDYGAAIMADQVMVQYGVKVPMRDRVNLRADNYRPTEAGRV